MFFVFKTSLFQNGRILATKEKGYECLLGSEESAAIGIQYNAPKMIQQSFAIDVSIFYLTSMSFATAAAAWVIPLDLCFFSDFKFSNFIFDFLRH